MKSNKYDFILEGCHSFTTIAACYFPSLYKSSSSRSLRRYISGHAALLADLLVAEYDEHDIILNPVQISIIISHMGMPGEACKNLGKS